MVKKGSVALITPCYNGEKYLNTWFDCIMRQTYQNVEIFVVDDGSTDNSAEILKSFENKFIDKGYAFHCYSQQNGGAASAVQAVLNVIETDYIYLYDVDDCIYENAIETMADFLNKNANYDMVRCNGYYTRNLSENKEGTFYTSDRLKNIENIYFLLLTAVWVAALAEYSVKRLQKKRKDFATYEMLSRITSHKPTKRPLIKWIMLYMILIKMKYPICMKD